jgi:outer membrane protein OmpA-like peptidoglycan-associated protein
MMHRIAAAAGVALALAAIDGNPGGAPLEGQRAPALGGAELRAGIVFPERAVLAPAVMAEVDLGYVWRPELRVIAGISHFRANIDREPGDDEGSYGATGLWLGGRLDVLPLSVMAPYVRAAVTVHSVSADAWDTDVGALLDGLNAGGAIAVGARRVLDTSGSLAATIEVRRTALNNIANTAVEIGIRWQRRGAWSYVRDPAALVRAPPPVREPRDPRVPAGIPGRVERTPRPVQADTARLPDEARLQAEAAAVEERQAAEAAAATEAARRTAAERAAAAAAERVAASAALLRQGLDRAAAAMRSVSAVHETADALSVTLAGGAFATGASALSAAARAELRLLATVLAGYPGHIISVEGHTDAVGDPGANLALSVERAGAVRAALIVEGVDPLWVGTRGHGAVRPVASNETAAGRAANRRVEIRVSRVPCAAPPRPGPDGALICGQ